MKIKMTLLLSSLAYALLGISNLIPSRAGFIMALIGTFIMGIAFTIGELTMLGSIIIELDF